MALGEDIAYVSQLLDDYAIHAFRMGVAAESPADAGVPPEMQVGEVNGDGWVEWRALPSTLTENDVTAFEDEFACEFPPLFRAYLLARFQLFNHLKSEKYKQGIFMTDTPAGKPLTPLRGLMTAWQPLIEAGFVPFAEWGDGWGPMCFDAQRRAVGSDRPIVWMDHEILCPLGAEQCRQRVAVSPHAQPLYDSFKEFLEDVFVRR